MTLDQVMGRLEALGDEKTRRVQVKNGAGENVFGVKMGDLRVLAKEIKTDPALAAELWATGNLDAMFLATLVTNPDGLTPAEVEAMVRTCPTSHLADWLTTYVVKQHSDKESFRLAWLASDDPMCARAGWSLTAERIVKSPGGLDLPALLDRIHAEMPSANPLVQWTMNFCLGETGINFPEYRARAIAIGEELGLYRDYPVSKGCVPPYVPIWVNEMVRRSGK